MDSSPNVPDAPRPFVPHNLISIQESPLPEFQMSPRHKILMSSGSKRGIQVYHPFLYKKLRQANPFQVPPTWPPWRYTCLQGIFTYLLIYLYISKLLRKERLSMFPKSGPLWEQKPIPEPYLTYLSGVLCKGVLPRGSMH
jgi:hypothetical protein